MATKEEAALDFIEESAGQGFENMTTGETAVPRLLISQAMSDVTQNGQIPAGHFYNSISGKDYGETLDVIVCHFQKVWVEWKKNQGGYVATHEIGSIEVTGDNYKGMEHVDADGNKNDVIETWMYLVVLPDHLEDGYLVFGSTRGNLKYLKGWNTQMMYLRTPLGNPAPLFSSVWTMSIGKDTNKKGNTYYSCNKEGKSSIVRKGWTTKEMFLSYVKPAREVATQAVALADNRAEVQAIEAPTEESSEF
jgi:hypothetical protein